MSLYKSSTIYKPSGSVYATRSVYVPVYQGDPAPVYENFHLVDSEENVLETSDGDKIVARERVV